MCSQEVYSLMENNMLSHHQSWKITLPDNYQGINIWDICLGHNIAAGNWNENVSYEFQLKLFRTIAAGDWVIAYLRRKTIGGIGRVTSLYDYQIAEKRPKDLDFFRGNFWHRIGVRWLPVTINIDILSKSSQNPFRTPLTLMKISDIVLNEILDHINNEKRNSLLQLEFRKKS
jgi:hypothetical protein